MIVHRFMSFREYNKLTHDKTLRNETDHTKKRKGKSGSKGFCFFVEDPDEAVHWLSGIVDLDVCVTFNVPDDYLCEGWGKYADESQTDFSKPMSLTDIINAPLIKRKEYWRFQYCKSRAHIVDVRYGYKDQYPSKQEQKAIMKQFLLNKVI